MRKGTPSTRRSALGSGALTALSTVAVSGSAAVVGALLARTFGHGEDTDGFFAAYGLYLVLTLVASALRVVVLPAFTRAREEGRLGAEIAADALALTLLAVPAVLLSTVGADWTAGWLTGGVEAEDAAADALVWLVPAAVAQLYAGLLASALAAADDYGSAALGYAAGAVAGLALIFWRVDADGLVALSWGLALNSAIAAAVIVAAAARRGVFRGPAGERGVTTRLRRFGRGVAIPLVLQSLYVVALGLAGSLGAGSQTSLGYAYLAAAFLVAATASSLSLVSSAPLTRRGLGDDGASRHIVSASWLSLAVAGAAAGVFALAGERVVRLALGSAYGGETGAELGRLIAYLSPWVVATIALSVAFPLLFVDERTRRLPLLSVAVLALHVPLTWLGREWLGLAGIAAVLALTTTLLLAALLLLLSRSTLVRVARGLVVPVLVCSAVAVVAFGAASAVFDELAAAAVGLAAYAAALAALRPRGLRESFAYLRELR